MTLGKQFDLAMAPVTHLQSKNRTSLVAQKVKNLPAIQETWVWSLGWEDLLEKRMVIHSSILAWRIPWTEGPCGLQAMGSQRVRHNWETNTFTFTLRLDEGEHSARHSQGVPPDCTLFPFHLLVLCFSVNLIPSAYVFCNPNLSLSIITPSLKKKKLI